MQAAPRTRRELVPWSIAVLAPAGVLALAHLVAPHLPLVPLLAYAAAFVAVSAEVLVAAALAPRWERRAIAGIVVPIGALVAVVLAPLPTWLAAMIVTSALLSVGTLAGGVVGGAIQKPGHLLVVAVVSSMADAFSVLHPSGPTAQIVQVEEAVSVLVLPWPMLGTARIEPVLGVGDVTFAALYLAAARAHALPLARTLIALSIALAVTFAVVLTTELPIPALPFLGVAMIAAHPAARRLPREERRVALLGMAALAILFASLFAFR